MSTVPRHFRLATDLSADERNDIFNEVELFLSEPAFRDCFFSRRPLAGAVLAPFYQGGSVRTKSGFAAAFIKLGGGVLDLDKTATALFEGRKAESLEDIVEYLSLYADAFVLRTQAPDVAAQFFSTAKKPVLSAGVIGEDHPITCLANAYAMLQELSGLSRQNVLMISSGPSATLTGLARLLDTYEDNTIAAISPNRFDIGHIENHFSCETHSVRDFSLEKFSVIVVDESERNEIASSMIENLKLRKEYFNNKNNKASIFHIKPIIHLLDDSIKSDISGKSLLVSKISFIIKMIILKKFLKYI